MMAEERWSVQKLDGSNWMTWKFQMRHMLLDRELWGFVEGSEVLDADASEGRQAMFKRSSQKALTAIIMAMASTQIYIVQSCETPDDAWRKLQGHFEKGTLASKLHLRKRYFRMEMTEGTMVEKHLREMKELTDRLAAIGSPIAEEDQVMTLLGSLPSSFSPLVTTLGAQLDKVTWADVEHALRDEQCRKEKFQTGMDTALVGVQGKPHNVKKALKCFLCGQKGHFKWDCSKQKANEKKEQGHNAKAATDNAEQEEAFHAPAGQVGTLKYHKWLIDSGASCHMTWDESILYEYSTFDEPEPVGLGDGYPVEALGMGKVRIMMQLGNGQDISRVIENVLYVPQLTTSLFSVRAVTRKGYRVIFEDEECRIETKQGKLLGKGIVDGKLFKLDCIPSGSQAAIIAGDSVTDVDLWHQRLGQVSKHTLKEIAQEVDFGHDNKVVLRSFNPKEPVTYQGTCEVEKQPREPEETRPERQRRPPVQFGIGEFVTHYAYGTFEIARSRRTKRALSRDQITKWKATSKRKPVGCKWIFKVKHDESGEVG